MNKTELFNICSDIHLMDRIPKCRSETAEEWYTLQLKFIEHFSKLYHPVIAGDLFDLPDKNSDLLVSSVIERIYNPLYAIAGNHDFPLRNEALLKYSSFGILKSVGLIKDITFSDRIASFDWQDDAILFNKINETSDDVDILIIHKFIYDSTGTFKNAPESGKIQNLLKLIPNHIKLIIAGDNHTGFIYSESGRTVLNCGSVHRITAGQVDYSPRYYTIYDDLSIKENIIDCSSDKISREYIDLMKARKKSIKEFADSIGENPTLPSFKDLLFRISSGTECEEYIKNKYEELNGHK